MLYFAARDLSEAVAEMGLSQVEGTEGLVVFHTLVERWGWAVETLHYRGRYEWDASDWIIRRE
jgi:hypothetical protein